MNTLNNRKPSKESIEEIVKYCDSVNKSELEALTYDEVETIDATDVNWCYDSYEIKEAREYGRTGSDEAIINSLVSSALLAQYEEIMKNK